MLPFLEQYLKNNNITGDLKIWSTGMSRGGGLSNTAVAYLDDMLDENGRLPNIRPALLSDAIATSAGAILGTSTTTTFVESSAGVAIGGRTGLTALTTGVLFLLATLFSPLFTSIPAFATAPALIFVGFLMFEAVLALKFDADSLTDTIPAYICILAMPLFYSISEGICFGVISYVVIKMATGKAKEVAPLMYVLAVLFVLKYIFL
jgi:AGZA family xanthine/uracil permease-like MFS transporter